MITKCTEDGYCEHGTYVGGCGIDWMCGWCEEGVSWEDYVWILTRNRISRMVSSETTRATIYFILLEAGHSAEAIAENMRMWHF